MSHIVINLDRGIKIDIENQISEYQKIISLKWETNNKSNQLSSVKQRTFDQCLLMVFTYEAKTLPLIK